MIRDFFTVFFVLLVAFPVMAAEPAPPCAGGDRACLLKELESTTTQITDDKWRDISLRELAKSYAQDNRTTEAIALIDKIKNPDTQAMTIRGIGMATAELALPEETYTGLFKELTTKATSIQHEPSREIAYTYISMAQAFAKQDAAAIATANAMTNVALRHKAFGEMAEIQAERKDSAAALATLARIDTESYRNKATRTVTLLLSDRGLFEDAAKAAHGITNPTLKAEAIQYILMRQKQPGAAK